MTEVVMYTEHVAFWHLCQQHEFWKKLFSASNANGAIVLINFMLFCIHLKNFSLKPHQFVT